LQNESGLYEYNNLYGVDTFDQRRQCDFDGDGAPDDLIATGVTLWYWSSLLGGRWVYLEDQAGRDVNDAILRDVNGDGLCDVTVGGVVHLTPNGAILDNYNASGSAIAAARRSDGGVEAFGTNGNDAAYHAGQTSAGGPLGGWQQFDGSLRSIAAATDTDGRIEVFGVDGAGNPLLEWQTTPGGAYSAGWTPLGGVLRSIGAARNADG